MLMNIISAPVTAPFSLTMWIVRTIAGKIDEELYDEAKIRKELTELEMRCELGEISDEDYERLEENLMARLRESRRRRGLETDGQD
jgi:hypothetical protein